MDGAVTGGCEAPDEEAEFRWEVGEEVKCCFCS